MAIKPKYIVNKTMTASKEFTDRDEFLVAFNRAINRENLDENKILVYYGVGGIGKSSLISKICMNIGNEAEYAILDVSEGNNKNVENALFSLRKSFSKVKFPLFDLAYAAYWKKCHPNTVMSEKTFPYLEEGGIALNIISTLGDFPLISLASSIINIAGKVSQNLKNYYISVRNEVQLIENMSISELEEKLPYYFASDFEKYMDKKIGPKVIFIDTYEAIWESERTEGLFLKRDQWVRDLAAALPRVLFVICGREKLRWNEENPEWDDYIEQHLIGALSDNDAKKFLRASNITDEIIQDAIIDGSDGVPYYLDLAVDTYYSIKRENKKCTAEDFAGTPKEIFYRFIKHLTTSEIESLKVLAVPRYFDYYLFSSLVKEFNTGYPITSFYEFCNFSFITEREDEKFYEMHRLMKDSLIMYQNDNLKVKINEFMTNYYDAKLTSEGHNSSRKYIKVYMDEYYYHCKNAYGLKELCSKLKEKTAFLKEIGEYDLIVSIIGDLLKTANLKEMSKDYWTYFAYELVESCMVLGRYKEAESCIVEILPILDEYKKVYFLQKSIVINKELYGIEKSITTAETLNLFLDENKNEFSKYEDFNEQKAKVLIDMGKLYVFVKRIKEAESTYKEAKDISDNLEILGVINERLGEIYSEYLNDFEMAASFYYEAIINYKKIINKNENVPSAILLNMGLAYKRTGENLIKTKSIEASIENCRKAVAIYDEVISSSPSIVDSYIKKGFAYTDWLKVIMDFQEYRALCDEFFIKGTEAFIKALDLNPYDRSVLTGLNEGFRYYGILLCKSGKLEKALDYINKAVEYGDKAIEAISDHPYSYISRAKSYMALGDIYVILDKRGKAIESYNKAIYDHEMILKLIPEEPDSLSSIHELKHKIIDLAL